MMRDRTLVGSVSPRSSLLLIAIGAGLVAAAIEFPISQYYATVPATTTGKRMAIAGGMAIASVLVAGWIARAAER